LTLPVPLPLKIRVPSTEFVLEKDVLVSMGWFELLKPAFANGRVLPGDGGLAAEPGA
jgi:hypothetical protein